MSANMVALAYLIAAVLIIFALKGLSSPESSRRGNLFGMIGMLIAIVVTLQLPGVQNYTWIFAALAVGGLIGGSVARKIPMTHMPQLVAFMHSLVGLAAVLIAVSAFYDPAASVLLMPLVACIWPVGSNFSSVPLSVRLPLRHPLLLLPSCRGWFPVVL